MQPIKVEWNTFAHDQDRETIITKHEGWLIGFVSIMDLAYGIVRECRRFDAIRLDYIKAMAE